MFLYSARFILNMKKKVLCWFLFALIAFGAGLSSAQEVPLTVVEGLLISEELLPTSWSTVTTRAGDEQSDIKLFQYLSSPQSPVEISYIIEIDPESTVFDSLNSDTSFDYETKILEVPLESGITVSATVKKIKKDDPKVQFDVARLIKMFVHYEGFTFTVSSDSWVLLESAGDPEAILKEVLKAGLETASSYDLKGFDTVPPTTTTTIAKETPAPTSPVTIQPTLSTSTTEIPTTLAPTPSVTVTVQPVTTSTAISNQSPDSGVQGNTILIAAAVLVVVVLGFLLVIRRGR